MNIIRILLEKASRGIILKRRLPRQFNRLPLFVSPDSALRYWRFSLWKADPVLFNVVLELVRANDVVWDVGANQGLFSLASACITGRSGKVLAFEPDIFLSNLLRRSAGINHNIGRIDVLNMALSDSVGIKKFNIAMRGRARNYLEESGDLGASGGIRQKKPVFTATLDWLIDRFPAPNVLKIDTEGAEYKILWAAKKFFSVVRPAIFCEVQPQNIESITNIFKDIGYFMYAADENPHDRKPLECAHFNTIALSRSCS